MRLDKLLSNYSGLTRTQAKDVCKKARVSVNGTIIKDSSFQVNETDSVLLDGTPVNATNRTIVYLLNKPAGYVCANEDRDCKTVLELMPEQLRKNLLIVGRLDKDSTGLLLLTNDGALVHKLTSPKSNINKTYEVYITGHLDSMTAEKLENGVDIGDDTLTKPAIVEIVNEYDEFELSESDINKLPKDTLQRIAVSVVRITITEGRFHQVKRMFHSQSHEVFRLKRIKEGEVILPDNLEEGKYIELSDELIAQL